MTKPIIGISCGDINGIGPEVIIKALADNRILEQCTPVIFGSQKLVNFYKKAAGDQPFNFQVIKDFTRINHKQVNVFACWEEDVAITPGQLNETGGKYAVMSLLAAADALKAGHIHGLVTAPIHKKNVQGEGFAYTGHTPWLKEVAGADDVLMLLYTDALRVALLTEHVPVKDVAQYVTRGNIISKLRLLHNSLRKDFGIDKPKIAVLGLNPHAGDEGLIGEEEENIIKPTLREARQHMLVFGPYSADAFFARHSYQEFDAVLALYHDQGLIPFKTIAGGEGVNFSAGLPFVRTSPDHGTGFDIAGKNVADATSFLTALFGCLDIINSRAGYEERTRNPLRKITAQVLKNMEDEKIEEA
ncbi:4-hydroxythreonine-4-phosphate dehydrogenase [Cnuella takakiae]|uniref:4-hydroxythreonine-4-phosphate dehydrogenase n=1 Tax=Cnuella takakiae TaxID=1302690 RepID=A0A1M5DAH0_9BACT|nr:4-hydroxythreonine-4-phosphate dehydrogenase PdxA [Cnuella takakiae]OLY94044.1 4-hydroxythreonine-4-phosphate dehydrogenase PdxA [Cnuella takakiae]SHF63988.1 4-hydroxythreonine-4-phosphate dehydrogenase [Cnuella takakiae]